MAFCITWEVQRVYVQYSGPCSADEVLKVAILIQNDCRFDEIQAAIHDFSACDEVSYSKSDFEELAAGYIGAFFTNPRLKVALIGDRPDVLEMLDHVVGVDVHSFPMRQFSKVAEAIDWLCDNSAASN